MAELLTGVLPRVIETTFTTVANEVRRFPLTCNQIYCRAGLSVTFQMFDQDGRPVTEKFTLSLGQKMTLNGVGYFVEVRSTTIQTVTFLASIGDFDDNSLVLAAGAAVVSTPATMTAAPDALTPVASGIVVATASSPQIATAGATVRQRTIRRDSAGAGFVYLSPTALTVGQITAWALSPGEKIVVNHSGALYCRNDTGGSATMTVMNESA